MTLAMPAAIAQEFALEDASADDFEDLLGLRLRAMRHSLEQIGRYDEQRARTRLAEGFDPAQTKHIVVNGQRVGFIVLKTLSHAMRLDTSTSTRRSSAAASDTACSANFVRTLTGCSCRWNCAH